jgi:hypothetical protein
MPHIGPSLINWSTHCNTDWERKEPEEQRLHIKAEQTKERSVTNGSYFVEETRWVRCYVQRHNGSQCITISNQICLPRYWFHFQLRWIHCVIFPLILQYRWLVKFYLVILIYLKFHSWSFLAHLLLYILWILYFYS